MTSPARKTLRTKFSRGPKYYAVLGFWLVGLLVAMLVLTLVDSQVEDAPLYLCPPDCGSPPTGLPVSTNPRFTAPGGEFSVSYPAPGAAYAVSTDETGVTATLIVGDGGTMRFFGTPAVDSDARQVVEQFIADAFPDAVVAYELPNATVGFELGYGVVADFVPEKRSDPLRIIVIAAVKDDLALVAAAEGPFREFRPGFGPGPPSAANLQIAQEMGKYVNSFGWGSDPPR